MEAEGKQKQEEKMAKIQARKDARIAHKEAKKAACKKRIARREVRHGDESHKGEHCGGRGSPSSRSPQEGEKG
jgi:hypothetical protein